MSSVAQVTIHESQFPDRVRRDLVESLRSRRVNQKFHYESIKQAHKWLRLHEAYSPARTDPDCEAAYVRSFEAVGSRIAGPCVHLIGLGCGGGQKEARLLESFSSPGRELFYTPVDVSTALVLVAREAALRILPESRCRPLVCDLATADDLLSVLDGSAAESSVRLLTFFGLIPNFEPELILPRLSALVRSGDFLLFSANLAPGPDYAQGVQHVLPLYDNELTRDWLMTWLFDLGVEPGDGQVRFSIEADPADPRLKRITADFHFAHGRKITLEGETFEFPCESSIQLFFSYRYTPALTRTILAEHGLHVLDQWITRSEEEGVFLVGRSAVATDR